MERVLRLVNLVFDFSHYEYWVVRPRQCAHSSPIPSWTRMCPKLWFSGCSDAPLQAQVFELHRMIDLTEVLMGILDMLLT